MAESRRDRLRAELLQLRLRASLSQRALGEGIGATHGTVRRIEQGETLPKMQHVRRWLDTVAAADETLVNAAGRQRILDLAEATHAETRGWDELLGQEG